MSIEVDHSKELWGSVKLALRHPLVHHIINLLKNLQELVNQIMNHNHKLKFLLKIKKLKIPLGLIV